MGRDYENMKDRKMKINRKSRAHFYSLVDPHYDQLDLDVDYTFEEIEHKIMILAEGRGYSFFYGHRMKTVGYASHGRKVIQVTPHDREDIFEEFCTIAHEVGHIMMGHAERTNSTMVMVDGIVFTDNLRDVKMYKREIEAWEWARNFIKKFGREVPQIFEGHAEKHLAYLRSKHFHGQDPLRLCV